MPSSTPSGSKPSSSAAFSLVAQKVMLSAELISSRRFGGWPMSLPTSGPIGLNAFIATVGRARLGALRPETLATVSTASLIVVGGPAIT